MAKVTIGGKTHEVPVLNFKKLKMVWSLMQEVQESADPMDAVESACKIVALGLTEVKGKKREEIVELMEAKASEIEDDLLATEIAPFRDSVREIMVEAGMLKDGGGTSGSGEGDGVESSTGISTPSSPNSSQQGALEATGTE